MSGILYGVGLGPGDPGLITVKSSRSDFASAGDRLPKPGWRAKALPVQSPQT